MHNIIIPLIFAMSFFHSILDLMVNKSLQRMNRETASLESKEAASVNYMDCGFLFYLPAPFLSLFLKKLFPICNLNAIAFVL